MRVTNSERTLLAILALVVVGGGMFFGYKALNQKQKALNLNQASLRADQAEAEVDLQRKNVWATRKTWIKDHEPSFGEEGDTRAQVLNVVVKGARDHHLEVLDQNLTDVQHGAGGARVDVEIKVKGSMEGLCRWVAELQKPDSFYAVSLFSLKADQDEKSMVCTMQVARYFREKSK